MIDHNHWLEAQAEELSWWRNCANTYWEERKQIVYATFMGLQFYEDGHSPYNIEIGEKNILDLGGGPCSLLLKTTRFGNVTPSRPKHELSVVVDPCRYPDWVAHRYHSHGIDLRRVPAEHVQTKDLYDEVWLYNVLQHTEDPAKIIQNGFRALRSGGIFRVFEWVNTPVNDSHPHSLTEEFLTEALGEGGNVDQFAHDGCFGSAFSGEFVK